MAFSLRLQFEFTFGKYDRGVNRKEKDDGNIQKI